MRLGKFFKKSIGVLENEVNDFNLKENVDKVKDLFGEIKDTVKNIEEEFTSDSEIKKIKA